MRNRKRAKFCKNIQEKMISWIAIKMASLILYDACRILFLVSKFIFFSPYPDQPKQSQNAHTIHALMKINYLISYVHSIG
ncbi:MAG TPA: hypothetical protein PKL29_07290, partial [Methanothrix sp.]|nr:hypothetical protein [Methanothrix sp.]